MSYAFRVVKIHTEGVIIILQHIKGPSTGNGMPSLMKLIEWVRGKWGVRYSGGAAIVVDCDGGKTFDAIWVLK